MRCSSTVSRHILCIGTAAILLGVGSTLAAEPLSEQSPGDALVAPAMPDIERHITAAAERFRVPPHWIRAVIAVESAGDPRAVSRAGAMGLMQIMPATWAELRAAHDLGADPFDPRDNILAGTAYLRAMYDRFGAPGFLAAYNAGPGRYAEHLATGRPLPRETRDYVATLAPMIAGDTREPMPPRSRSSATDWRNAPLFAARPPELSADAVAPAANIEPGADEVFSNSEARPEPGLFVPLQGRRKP
jgi:Transglycosylase SLT domain